MINIKLYYKWNNSLNKFYNIFYYIQCIKCDKNYKNFYYILSRCNNFCNIKFYN